MRFPLLMTGLLLAGCHGGSSPLHRGAIPGEQPPPLRLAPASAEEPGAPRPHRTGKPDEESGAGGPKTGPLDEARQQELIDDLLASVGDPRQCIPRDPRILGPVRLRLGAVVEVGADGRVISASLTGGGLSEEARECLRSRIVGHTYRAPVPDTPITLRGTWQVELAPPPEPQPSQPPAAPTPPPAPAPGPASVAPPTSGQWIQGPSGVPVTSGGGTPTEGPSGTPLTGPGGVPVSGPGGTPIGGAP